MGWRLLLKSQYTRRTAAREEPQASTNVMIDFPEKVLWTQILRTSEMRMFNSRQTNAIAFDRMEETRKAILRTQESIRRTDEFIRRVMPISK
jgi:hypothetical protein